MLFISNLRSNFLGPTGFGYEFATPEYTQVFEEYLIHDFIGTIGSIGGIVGMFVGFSNFISIFIKCLQSIFTSTIQW